MLWSLSATHANRKQRYRSWLCLCPITQSSNSCCKPRSLSQFRDLQKHFTMSDKPSVKNSVQRTNSARRRKHRPSRCRGNTIEICVQSSDGDVDNKAVHQKKTRQDIDSKTTRNVSRILWCGCRPSTARMFGNSVERDDRFSSTLTTTENCTNARHQW